MSKKKSEQIEKQMEAVGKGFGKLGFNYYCKPCNEYFRWNKLVSKRVDALMIFMTCPNCGEMVEDYKQYGRAKYAKKPKAKVKKG